MKMDYIPQQSTRLIVYLVLRLRSGVEKYKNTLHFDKIAEERSDNL